MTKIRKMSMLLLVLCLLISGLAGCGTSSSSSSEEAAEESTETEAEAESAEVTEEAEEVEETEETEETESSEDTEETAEAEASEDAEDSEETESSSSLTAYTLPLTEEDVTFTIWCEGASSTVASSFGDGQSYNTSDATIYLNELLGVTVEYVEFDMMSGSEKFTLMIASGDYTDIISDFDGSYSGGSLAGYEDGIIIDLTDIVADMPYYSAYLEENQDYEKLVTSDNGMMLMIASFCEENYTQQGGTIRNDWLEELGLEVPTTYDELTEVALAFKTAYDCSATIYWSQEYNPMINFSAGLDLPEFDFTDTGSAFYQIDGEIQYAYVREEFKEMVKMVQNWYNLGLISPDFVTLGGGGDSQTYINNGMTGISYNRAESITDYNEQLGDTGFEMVAMPNLVQEEGQVLHFSPEQAGVYSTISVSATCENLDVLAAFLDWGFTEEGILASNYGMEGYSYTINDDGEPEFTEAMLDHNVGFKQSSERYMRHATPTIVDVDCGFEGIYDELGLEAIEIWNQNYDGAYDLPSTLSITSEENETYSAVIADVETYVQEWVLKATVSNVDIDAEWDNYVETVYSYGLQDCIDIMQDSYDRYLER